MELLAKHFCLKIGPESYPTHIVTLRTVRLVTLGPSPLTTVDQLNVGTEPELEW